MSKSSLRERQKAVRLAWEREQRLVSEGKGTRNWSSEQQKDILDPDKGKAYDENGRAFEGQHMKSAEQYPEYQGDPNNIQFLTREEHLEAHKGSWQNPTNWYYDPATKEFVDFGDGDIIPCQVIELDNPISTLAATEDTALEKPQKTKETENIGGSVKRKTDSTPPPSIDKRNTAFEKAARSQKAVPKSPKRDNGFVRGLKEVGRFIVEHPVESLEIAGVTIGSVAKIVHSISSSRGNGSSISRDTSSISSVKSDIVTQVEEIIEKASRSSPREHDVSGYDRMQNGKKVHVNPYKRGGKKDL